MWVLRFVCYIFGLVLIARFTINMHPAAACPIILLVGLSLLWLLGGKEKSK